MFKGLLSSRMLSIEICYRLYHAYIRPYFQSILDIYPILSVTKKKQLEALNRQIFRIIHRWYDSTNDEIINLPMCKSIELHTQLHFTKLLSIIMRSNPSVIADFIEHKLYLL